MPLLPVIVEQDCLRFMSGSIMQELGATCMESHGACHIWINDAYERFDMHFVILVDALS
jgi:hypothetical protein